MVIHLKEDSPDVVRMPFVMTLLSTQNPQQQALVAQNTLRRNAAG